MSCPLLSALQQHFLLDTSCFLLKNGKSNSNHFFHEEIQRKLREICSLRVASANNPQRQRCLDKAERVTVSADETRQVSSQPTMQNCESNNQRLAHRKRGCRRATGKSVSMRVAFWWGPSRPPLNNNLASSARRATSSSLSPSLLWQLPIATTCSHAHMLHYNYVNVTLSSLS